LVIRNLQIRHYLFSVLTQSNQLSMWNLTKTASINRELTKRVTELHDKGYDRDFCLTANHQLFCVQNSNIFNIETASIKLIDHIYDKLFQQYKYLYVVESDSGEKGILLLNFIHFDAISANKDPAQVN